jgi:hypothetical protein
MSKTIQDTATNTKVIDRLYIKIDRVIDTDTGWSYIERVYSSFWDKSNECLRETTYGLRIATDQDVFQAVQGSLEDLEKEGYSWSDARVEVSHEIRTNIKGTYWDVIGRHF